MIESKGDSAGGQLLLQHNQAMRAVMDRHRGRELETTGDGFLAMFDSAAGAVRCGRAMTTAASELGISIRVGCHTGEIVMVAGKPLGVAVHAAVLVMALGGAGDVLVSGTTHDLLEGTGISLTSLGSFELKGITGPRDIFRVA